MRAKARQATFLEQGEMITWVLAQLGARYLAENAANFCPEERPQVLNHDQAYNLVAHMSLLNREELWIMCLDIRNRLLAIQTVAIGGLNTVSIKPADVFRPALKVDRTASIILVHNHPSGDPTPSWEDIQFTRMIKQAGELLGIEVLDHIIVGQWRYVSWKRDNWLV